MLSESGIVLGTCLILSCNVHSDCKVGDASVSPSSRRGTEA